MTIGRVVSIKKLYAYITGKSVKQRICICIVATAMITLLVFTVKANFFDRPVDNPQTEISESIETSEGENSGNVPAKNEPPVASGRRHRVGDFVATAASSVLPPQFHISLIDVGVLLVVVTAYCIHKFREKRKQGRL